MIVENTKLGKFYSFNSNFLIITGLALLFTPINVLGIFSAGIIINTSLFILFNFSKFMVLIKDNYIPIIIFMLCPMIFIIIAILHKDLSLFLLQNWLMLSLIPIITLCLTNYCKLSNKYLVYAFIFSGLVLIVRFMIYFFNDSYRFISITPYNTIHSGTLVAIYSLISIYLTSVFFNIRMFKLGVCGIIISIFSLLALLSVASKGPILAFLAIFILMSLYNTNFKKLLFSIIFIGTMIIFLYFLLGSQFKNKFGLSRFNEVTNIEQQYTQQKNTSTGIRLQLYKVALNSFIHNPLIGLGNVEVNDLENSMIDSGEIEPFVKQYFHFHSDIFNTMGRFGMFGMLGILIFWYMLFAFYKNNSGVTIISKHLKFIMLASFGTFIMSSLTDTFISGGSIRPGMILVFLCSIIYSIKIDNNSPILRDT